MQERSSLVSPLPSVQPPGASAAPISREYDDLEIRALAAAYAAALTVGVEYWASHGGDLAEHLRLALSVFASQH